MWKLEKKSKDFLFNVQKSDNQQAATFYTHLPEL